MAIDTHDEAAGQALLAAAEADTSPIAKKARQKRRVDIITLVTCMFLTPFFVFASVKQMTKLGLDFDLAFIVPLVLSGATLLLFAATVTSLVRVNIDDGDISAVAIRWAASAGDERVAPLALLQPPIGSQSDAPIEPFDLSCSWVRDRSYSFNDLALTAVFVFWGISVILYLSGFQLLAGAIYLPSAVLFFVAAFRRDREAVSFLRVDEQGLHGRYAMQSRAHVHVSWEQIRSFIVRERPAEDKDIWLRRLSVDAGDDVVTWDDRAKLGTHPYSVWGQIAGLHLASVVAVRTGLPLRDTTQLWNAINAQRQRTLWDVADNPSVTFAIPFLDTAIRLIEERNREPWRRRIATLARAPLAVYVAICLVGAIIRSRG
jgi:hypothetical protein